MIEKAKMELAKEKINNYLNSMKSIGISYDLAVNYLQELGGKDGNSCFLSEIGKLLRFSIVF